MTTQTTISDAIKKYVALRDKKDRLDKEHKVVIDGIKKSLKLLESWIKTQADEDGVTSFKTKEGTAFISEIKYVSVGSWDAILKFVKTHDAYDMLQKRLAKVAVCNYIEEHEEIPPGVDYGSEIKVNIRRPLDSV